MEELTIIIPTYNRLGELRHTVNKILPQLRNEKLVVIDNNSPYDIHEELNDLVAISKGKLSLFKNKTNIGLSGNFLKAFEICNTKYLWILSDDDIPLENALKTINDDFSEGDFAYIKYSSSLYYEKEIHEIKTKDQFLNYYSKNTRGKFSNLVFISSAVFNMEKLSEYIQFGYQYANSFAPHLSIIFHSIFLNQSNVALISNKEIVEQVPPEEGRWTLFKVFLGFKSFELIDVNFTISQHKIFVKILRTCRCYYRTVFIELANLGNQRKEYTYSKAVYKFLFFNLKLNLVDRLLMLILYWSIDKPAVITFFRKYVKGFDDFYSMIDIKKSDNRL